MYALENKALKRMMDDCLNSKAKLCSAEKEIDFFLVFWAN